MFAGSARVQDRPRLTTSKGLEIRGLSRRPKTISTRVHERGGVTPLPHSRRAQRRGGRPHARTRRRKAARCSRGAATWRRKRCIGCTSDRRDLGRASPVIRGARPGGVRVEGCGRNSRPTACSSTARRWISASTFRRCLEDAADFEALADEPLPARSRPGLEDAAASAKAALEACMPHQRPLQFAGGELRISTSFGSA